MPSGKFQAPRGTQDVLPQDAPYWRYVIDTIHKVTALYGYEQMDLPMFEETPLYVRGVGEGTDIVDKEMYTFRDRGDSELTLRPELTAGVMRAFVQNGMHVWPKPVKLYAIGPCFRYERPQAGRFRQHTQLTVEAVGEQDPAVDLEVMSVAWQIYAELGAKNLSYQINSTGDPKCKPGYVQALVAYYQQHLSQICEDDHRRLARNPLRVLDCKVPSCQPVIEGAPHFLDYLCDDCATHFATLRSYLDALQRPYTINHRLVRGLDYYTKTVFEVWAQGIGAQNAVAGGGRYDGLVEMIGGPASPGVGFATGLERVILTLKEQGTKVPPLPHAQVSVVYLGQQARLEALRITSSLRAAGVPVAESFGSKSMSAQLKAANRLGAAFALIIGDDELARQVAVVRDLQSGTQEEKPLAGVLEYLISRTGYGV
jgi:histidyl-tRNA synthetase